ncbi:MAG: hypothetical protein ACPL2N_02555 [Candidatus Cryosericum sp.]
MDVVCTDEDSPADENNRDHIPVFLRNVVEEVQVVAKGCAGEIPKAVPMDLNGDARGSQLVKIDSNLPALATDFRKEDGDRDRSSRGIVRDSGGLLGTARKKEGEADHCNKYDTGPSHGQPSHETILLAYRVPLNRSTDGNRTVHCIPLSGKEKPCRS